jgi:carbamoyltransferase
MNFLGISLRNHDANITYSTGNKIKYLKFEREFQIKHYGNINYYLLEYIINKWDIKVNKINAIAYVGDMNFHNLSSSSDNSWFNSNVMYEKFKPKDFYYEKFKCPFFRVNHHYAHSLSMWPLINKTDVDFVCDAMGDLEDTYSVFKNNERIKNFEESEASSFGIMLNQQAHKFNISGLWQDLAGKLMGLKSYGKIDYEYINLFKDDIKEMFNLFVDRKYYRTKTKLEKNELNRLASCHFKAEQMILSHFNNFAKKDDIISFSGGVSQNSVLNTVLKSKFKNLHIPPHGTDDGLSLGLIEFLRQKYNQEPFEKTNFPFWQDDFCPKNEPSDQTILKTAELLANNKIVGWFQGNGELGPRALGNRSIFMNPTILNGRTLINQKIKKREGLRPFGASILEDHTKKYFNCDHKSEYMLYVTEIFDKKKFNSITHIDGTCRIQTVGNNFKTFKRLLDCFYKITGIPMLLNTSMNINGQPIASRSIDALELFSNTELDVLVIGNDLYKK